MGMIHFKIAHINVKVNHSHRPPFLVFRLLEQPNLIITSSNVQQKHFPKFIRKKAYSHFLIELHVLQSG